MNRRMDKPCARPSCGQVRDRPGQAYCRRCHREYMRANRKPYADFTEEEKVKARIRSYSHMLLRRGRLERRACQCGNAEVEMHHPEPSPYVVVWLCRRHHREAHRGHRLFTLAEVTVASARRASP